MCHRPAVFFRHRRLIALLVSRGKLRRPSKTTLFHCFTFFNPLNAAVNPICHLLALLLAHLIFHVSGLRVNLRSCEIA